ncbi:hypothetical protein CJO79_13190 [Ralstonia solanacearum]|nr:hypothetical protein CJO76_13210 [Ralstonia solanacearum]AXV91863.1 hypothetical protein CJO79_13190 [Ralstonia solanacearum]AXW76750.1 hypothetical protein CJO97_13180 [Ralstonia solanacearum]
MRLLLRGLCHARRSLRPLRSEATALQPSIEVMFDRLVRRVRRLSGFLAGAAWALMIGVSLRGLRSVSDAKLLKPLQCARYLPGARRYPVIAGLRRGRTARPLTVIRRMREAVIRLGKFAVIEYVNVLEMIHAIAPALHNLPPTRAALIPGDRVAYAIDIQSASQRVSPRNCATYGNQLTVATKR